MLLPSVGGLLEEKRRLLENVAMTVALYGAPVWASASSVVD